MKTAVSYRSYRLLWYFRRLFGRQLDLPVLVGSFSPTTLMTHNPVVVHSHDNLHHVPCLFGPSLLFQRLLKGKVKKQEACSRLSRLRLSWAIFYPLAVCAYNGKWSQRSINANFVLTSFAGSGSSFLDFLRLLGSSDQWISHSTAGSRLKIRRGWSCKISSSNRSSSCWWDQQPTQKLRTNLCSLPCSTAGHLNGRSFHHLLRFHHRWVLNWAKEIHGIFPHEVRPCRWPTVNLKNEVWLAFDPSSLSLNSGWHEIAGENTASPVSFLAAFGSLDSWPSMTSYHEKAWNSALHHESDWRESTSIFFFFFFLTSLESQSARETRQGFCCEIGGWTWPPAILLFLFCLYMS